MPRSSLFKVNRLCLKLALAVAAVVLGLGGGLYLASGLAGGALGGAAVGGGALAVGGATYAIAYMLLDARLRLARTTLRRIRRHDFEQLEAARITRGDELDALLRQVYRTGLSLEKEISELRKMEDYRREFLGDVSHELKTPIFAIQGFAETLLGGGLEDERFRRAFVEKILRNAARLSVLARDLQEISRIETGELKMQMAPFDLQAMVAEVLEQLEPAAQHRDVRLRHHIPAGLPRVVGDRERLRQVLVNLVDNAVKYNNPGGHVEVVARVLPAGEVKVSVVDDGIGVAPQDVPRLTERFFRVDKSRSRAQGGTGLGLAIAKHILQAHDRRLVIESQPGRGSTFGFTLPPAQAATS